MKKEYKMWADSIEGMRYFTKKVFGKGKTITIFHGIKKGKNVIDMIVINKVVYKPVKLEEK